MGPTLRMAWLEITGRCNLTCVHCYAGSSPAGTDGTMTAADWVRAIDQLGELGAGTVQLIGGEPTLHPGFADLVDHAYTTGLQVEVYTNLATRLSDPMWRLFSDCQVRLATSWYSDDPTEHEAITRNRGAQARTAANIARAADLGIPVRAGMVTVLDGQRTRAGADVAARLGATVHGTDQVRAVGRAAHTDGPGLCGRCGDGRVAIGPDGAVTPCVFARDLAAGNARTTPLARILAGPAWARVLARVPAPATMGCNPDQDGSDCRPAETEACNPAY